jgi:hypothetical protein
MIVEPQWRHALRSNDRPVALRDRRLLRRSKLPESRSVKPSPHRMKEDHFCESTTIAPAHLLQTTMFAAMVNLLCLDRCRFPGNAASGAARCSSGRSVAVVRSGSAVQITEMRFGPQRGAGCCARSKRGYSRPRRSRPISEACTLSERRFRPVGKITCR